MTTADPESLAQLLVVQDHDRTIDALRHKRASLPEIAELEALDAATQALQAQITEIGDRRHVLSREQSRLEDAVSLVEDRIKEEEGKLYGGDVTGVKDLQALQDEIRGLKARQLTMEDDIITVMEAAEPVEAELRVGQADLGSLVSQTEAANQRLADAQGVVDAERTEVETLRVAAASAIPSDLIGVYDRLRSQPGRVAVAQLVQGRCHGCHLELAAVEIDRLKKLPAEDLVHCDECGCILVR